MELHASCQVWVPVDEIPFKQRPSFTRGGRAYTPKRTLQFERQIRDAWRSQYGDCYADFEGPVAVLIETSRPLRKSNPKYWAGKQDLKKPDFDNLGKVVCDALNGLAYKDDAQIFEAKVHKFPLTPYGTKPRLLVRISYYLSEYQKEK